MGLKLTLSVAFGVYSTTFDLHDSATQMKALIHTILQADIISYVASFLPANEVAATLRLVNKGCARLLSSYVRVQLSRPVPHHAFVQRWCSRSAMRLLSLRRRLRLLHLTASSGYLDNLQAAMATAGWDPVAGFLFHADDLLGAAARAGHLHVCQWLRNQGCRLRNALYTAAEAGQQEVCEWLLAEGCLCEALAPFHAAYGGHMELAESLLSVLCREDPGSWLRTTSFLAGVAYSCDLSTFQREVQRYHHPESELDRFHQRSKIIHMAAASPTSDWSDKVEWLQSRGYPWGPLSAYRAACCPDVVKRISWLRQRGCPILMEEALQGAAKCGNLAAVQELLEEGNSIQVDAKAEGIASSAARGGHLPVLQLLHARGWPVATCRVTEVAALVGSLVMLQWLVLEAGVQLEASILNNAALSDSSLELVEWLRQQGCPWDKDTFTEAAKGGCEAVLGLLVEQGCPIPDDGQPYIVAARHGDLATLACLHQLEVPWGPDARTFTECVSGDVLGGIPPLSTLQWLVEAGCPVDVDEAASRLRYRDNKPAVIQLLQAVRQKQQQQGT